MSFLGNIQTYSADRKLFCCVEDVMLRDRAQVKQTEKRLKHGKI